jgi:dihydrofolate synthase/folylpolyglutamate synthase
LEEGEIRVVARAYRVTEKATNLSYRGRISLGGDYQAKNLQAVFEAFKVLNGVFEVSSKNIDDGIRKTVENTGLMGRWQILNRKPMTICDTGHNKKGWNML